jgi:RNA polymerase-interacting CarD/CdnL/TRCF family regulator
LSKVPSLYNESQQEDPVNNKEKVMSWSQWETEVLHIINNSDDENTRMVATATNAYGEELRAGNIQPGEYAELLRDLQRQITITENMSQFETKQRLNTAITALVTIASAV